MQADENGTDVRLDFSTSSWDNLITAYNSGSLTELQENMENGTTRELKLDLDRNGIPEKIAKAVTKKLDIPTIGIGAGRYCDGQVLVSDDLLGMFTDFTPKFVKKYANLAQIIKEATSQYSKEVKEGKFPQEVNTYK